MATTPSTQPFNSKLILEEKISEATLRAYYVGFDLGKFRLKHLAQVIADVIPEFALGFHQGTSVPMSAVASRLRDAAKRLYSTDKYHRRGEFGELILHLLLRDYFGSIPLVSKIYFKDSPNVPAHGFDGVHIVVTGSEKQLWLGESKLYDDGKAGISDLLNDLKTHFTADYLRQEFNLVSSKLPDAVPDIEHWRELLHEHQRLAAILDRVCVPMVCTYSSGCFNAHSDNTPECLKAFVEECRSLHESFATRMPASSLDILLLLLPVQDKGQLVDELHRRLVHMQSI